MDWALSRVNQDLWVLIVAVLMVANELIATMVMLVVVVLE